MITDNELIAEFMDWTRVRFTNDWKDLSGQRKINLCFDTSWDWLMPACTKWDNLPFNEFNEKQKQQYLYLCRRLDDAVTIYDISLAFKHFVECIKWYNKNKAS